MGTLRKIKIAASVLLAVTPLACDAAGPSSAVRELHIMFARNVEQAPELWRSLPKAERDACNEIDYELTVLRRAETPRAREALKHCVVDTARDKNAVLQALAAYEMLQAGFPGWLPTYQQMVEWAFISPPGAPASPGPMPFQLSIPSFTPSAFGPVGDGPADGSNAANDAAAAANEGSPYIPDTAPAPSGGCLPGHCGIEQD
jgi:hypothetical protein